MPQLMNGKGTRIVSNKACKIKVVIKKYLAGPGIWMIVTSSLNSEISQKSAETKINDVGKTKYTISDGG